jgi:hypothetical protein
MYQNTRRHASEDRSIDIYLRDDVISHTVNSFRCTGMVAERQKEGA